MSFLLNHAMNSQEVDSERIKLAEIQFEAMNTTFNTLMKTCRSKCIPDEYGEADLNKGEMTCIDRCVSKYYKANVTIGQHVQSKGMDPNNMVIYDRFKQSK